MPWDCVLKKNLLKSVLMSPMNNAWDPHKKTLDAENFHFSAIQT